MKNSEQDFLLFAQGLFIPAAEGKQLFYECMQPFQREVFEELAPVLHAVREGERPKWRRWWLERTKGAAKDSDIAVCLMWLLAFPRRPLELQVGAADRDQAAIVRSRMKDLIYYNPWLAERVDVQMYRVTDRMAQCVVLDILAADIHGSHGGTPDLLVVNELSHVQRWEFVENLLDNADKVARGLVIIATNAGIKGTRAEKLRNIAINHPKRWRVRMWKTPAPWISKEDVADADRRERRSRFNRLWYGIWSSGTGDALDEEDIERCIRFHKGPILKPEEGWMYLGGLDLGVSHDHAALVILGVQILTQRIRIAWIKGWAPGNKTKEVDLIDVEEMVLKMSVLFRLVSVGFDPTEARLMAQRLRRKGVGMEEYSFSSPKNLSDMANGLVQVIGMLEGYEDDEGRLRRDFGKLSIVEKTYGCKLEAVSDQFGHADVGVALSICVPKAIQMLSGRVGLQRGDELLMDEGEELTKEELENMPWELKDIYDSPNKDEVGLGKRGGEEYN